MINDLLELKKINGDGFLFSRNGGIKPVERKYIYYGLMKAFKNIGLTDNEIKQRGLNVHAWRHFCNTALLSAGMPLAKVQAVTRHKTKRSTERYTHFDMNDLRQVTEVQAALLKPKKENQPRDEKPEAAEKERPVFKIVKGPEAAEAGLSQKVS